MFSLITTVLGIVLAIVLAISTLYFGGSSISEGKARTIATKIIMQSQQMLAASDMYFADKGVYPSSTAELVSGGYLRSIPRAQGFSLISEAYAADGVEWSMPQPGVPVYELNGRVAVEVCREVNRQGSMTEPGILILPNETLALQCYGGNAGELSVVVTGKPTLLVMALAEDVTTGNIPASNESPNWFIPPDFTGTLPTADPSAPELVTSYQIRNSVGAVLTGVAFGDVAINEDDSYTVSIVNTGTAPIPLGAISATGNMFTKSASGCQAQSVVQPGQSCSMTLAFNPVGGESSIHFPYGIQEHSGSLNLDIAGVQQSLPLSGRGVGAIAQWPNDSYNFGSRMAGEPAYLVKEMKNLGNIAADFNFSLPSGMTATACNNIQPQGTCQVTFTYLPVAGVSLTGSASVTNVAKNVTRPIFSGTGVAPIKHLTMVSNGTGEAVPSTIDFGSQVVGVETSRYFNVYNTGNVPLVLGANPLDVSAPFSASGCANQTLQPGYQCTLNLRFNPTSGGPYSYSSFLTINASGGAVLTQGIAGTGFNTALVATSGADTGWIRLPHTTIKTLRISNSGDVALTLGSLPTFNSPFEKLSDACSGQVLAAGSFCEVQIRYTDRYSGSTMHIDLDGFYNGERAYRLQFSIAGGLNA